jgi:tight adherence protein B
MTLVWFILVVVGLLSLAGVLWSLWQIWQERYSERGERFEKRIKDVSILAAAGQEIVTPERLYARQEWLNQWLVTLILATKLDRKLCRAGLRWLVADFLLLTLLLAALGILLFLSFGASSVMVLLGTVLVGSLPYGLLSIFERRRQQKLESQLPDVLEFIARSMQAGHAFSSALQMAAAESPRPIGAEFQTAFNQVNLGMPVQQALTGLAQRIDCPDMRYFSVAVLINREVGGDLAGLLRNVADLIRARLKLRLSIRAITAEGRISAWILGLLPFILAGLLVVLNPTYIAPLWQDPAGQRLVLYALVFMGFGILWMVRLTRVKI